MWSVCEAPGASARPIPIRAGPSRRPSRAIWYPGTSPSSWTATAAGRKQRGLPRTEGHKEGESSLLDVIMGAIELGIPYLSAYAFSTENWRRSPDEVRFLMGFNRDVIHRRRDLLNEMGVRIRWAGRRPRLWRSVIGELEDAERMSAGNYVLTLQFCVNYGGRAEIADAAAAIAADVAAGKLRPDKVNEKRVRPLPRRAGDTGRRSIRAVIRRAAPFEFPAVAVRLRRAGLPRHALARLRPAPSLARLRDLCQPGPPLRRRQAESASAPGGPGLLTTGRIQFAITGLGS